MTTDGAPATAGWARPDPSTFDPEVARESERLPPPVRDLEDVDATRAVYREYFRRVASRRTLPRAGVSIEELDVPSLFDDHRIPVRVYRPKATVGAGALVYAHGGAFVFGDLDLEDDKCCAWAREARCVVVAVDYRLAPEHRFPTAIEDCCSTLTWVADRAGDLAVDAARLGVGGCSAGGAIAAGLALLWRDRGMPELALQVLLYPVLDAALSTGSLTSMLTPEGRRDMELMWGHYLACPRSEAPPYASPAGASDLRGLPSTYIAAAQFDALRDDALAYAQRLADAGVSTELHLWPRVPHAFELLAPGTRIAHRSVMQQAQAIARRLGPRS